MSNQKISCEFTLNDRKEDQGKFGQGKVVITRKGNLIIKCSGRQDDDYFSGQLQNGISDGIHSNSWFKAGFVPFYGTILYTVTEE